MRAGLSFSRSPISLLLRQPLSIKKSYAGAIQLPSSLVVFLLSVTQLEALPLLASTGRLGEEPM
jgi:hypothetical protein